MFRDGDPPELLASFRDAGCDVKNHPFGYRSLHYVVKSQPDKKLRLAEIQVRTIFEEGWSEIDHRLRYPLHSSDPFLSHFLTIFNRLAGSADEMGTFINSLTRHFREQAAAVAATQAQLDEKESKLEETVSRLNLSEEQKRDLKKQVKDLQNSSRVAITFDNIPITVSAPWLSHFIPLSSMAAINVTSSETTCSQCGTRYLNSGPAENLSTCPKCGVISFSSQLGQ